MIDEAIGKILGMAMAYGVSVMGMFLAYVNYRKRIVKAEKVMSAAAWVVVLVTIVAVAGGVVVVTRLAASAPAVEVVDEAVAAEPGLARMPAPDRAPDDRPRSRWPWIGIVVPAGIFLLATLITASLHRHFSHESHSH